MNSVIIGSRVNSSNETAMAYALLIVEPSGQRQTRTEAEGRALYERMVRYSEDLKSRGLLTMTAVAQDRHPGCARAGSGRSTDGRRWSLCRSQGDDRRILHFDL